MCSSSCLRSSSSVTTFSHLLSKDVKPKCDKQYVVFGCIRIINIVFVSTWWNFSHNLDAIWIKDSGWPMEPCIRWGPDPPWEGAILKGEVAPHYKVEGHSVVHFAKMAEPTEVLFGFWTPMDHIRWGAYWHHLEHTTKPSMCSGDAACCQMSLTTCSSYCFSQ